MSVTLTGRGLLDPASNFFCTGEQVDGVVDELQLVIAPLFLGDPRSRQFAEDGILPWTATHRATLAGVQPIGDVVLLRCALSPSRCAGAGSGR